MPRIPQDTVPVSKSSISFVGKVLNSSKDQQQFVTVVRAVETALGIQAHGFQENSQQTSMNASHAIINMITTPTPNPLFDPSVIDALTETALILAQLSLDGETEFDLGAFAYGQSPLVTK